MIWEHLVILARVFSLAMSITKVQYSFGCLLISSDALRNCTRVMSIPTAFHISTMYCNSNVPSGQLTPLNVH